MTASLQVKSNRYYVVIAYKDDAGKWKHKWVNTQLTVDGYHKRVAKKMVEPILREWEPRLTSSSNIQFSDYLRQWLSQVRGSVAASTYAEYKKTVENCICPYFDAKKIALCDLKVFHIEEFYKAKLDGGTSASTIYHYHANINKALKDAVRLEKIPKNPASAVQLPKKEKHTANVYSDTELRMLLDKIKGTNMETVILLAAWFGLRRGEIIGLKWEHIDFSNKTLSVVGVISDKGVGSRTQNLRYVPFPKTDTSSRTFPLDDTMLDYLKGLKQQQEEKQRSAWYDHTWDGFVCVKDFAELYYSKNLAAGFEFDSLKFIDKLRGYHLPQKKGGGPQEMKLLVNSDDSARVQIARDLAAMLTDLGLPCRTLECSGGVFRDALYANSFDIYLGLTRLSPTMDLTEFFRPYGEMGKGGINNPTLYEMTLHALENSGNYYNLHKLLAEDGRIIPMLFGHYNVYAQRGLMPDLNPARDNVFYYSMGKTMLSIQQQPQFEEEE